MKKQYTHFTDEERMEFYALRKAGTIMTKICQLMGRSRATLYRELNRNSGDRGYRPKQAQVRAQKRLESPRHSKWSVAVQAYVTKALETDFSPKQISATMTLDGLEAISHERIYQFIYQDMQAGGMLYTHLRIRGTKKYRKRYGKHDYRGKIPNRVDIDQRPKNIENRKRTGDWEADLVSGAHHKGFLVTLVDRKTRFTLIGHVKHKTVELVTAETIRLLQESKLPVHTVTYDNGREFNGHMSVAHALDCKTYFAKPYHSWERGTNENTNGLIRQYFSKGTDLRIVEKADIEHAMDRLNDRPKEVLDFKSPRMVAYGSPRVALAA
jgi:IS30 family transposase